MFSFWVNNIFAEKQVLFDICGLMKSRQSSYQSDLQKEYMNLATDNWNKSGISKILCLE